MIKKVLLAIIIIGELLSGVVTWAQGEAEVNLNTIVVSAGLSPQPLEQTATNVTLITAEQIQAAHTQDISQLLNRLAGLDLPKQASLGNIQRLSIRGVSSQQVLILLDGYPLNSPSSGLTDLAQIPLENIAKIEIIRGAASALYGANAVGGVVNIITKKPKEKSPETTINIYGGSFNTQTYSFSFGAKPGDLDYLVSSSRSFAKGWRKNNDYENNALSTRVGYDLHKLGQLAVSNQYYRSSLGVPGISNIPLDQWDNHKEREAASPNARQEDHSNLTSFEYQLNSAEQIGATIKAYSNDTKQIYRNTDWSIDDSRHTNTRGIKMQLDFLPRVNTGLEYRKDSLWQRNNDLQTEVINEAVLFKSLYGQYLLKNEPWLFTLGTRYDHHSISGGQFNPRVGLVYLFSPDWKFTMNAARGFRPPTLNDLFWPLNRETYYGITYITVGNNNLRPEKAVSYDLGLENHYQDIWQTKGTLFYITTRDLILWQQDALTLTTYRWVPKNIAQGKNVGFELEIDHKINKVLKHNLNYTAMQAQGKKENGPDYLLLSRHPKHKLNYGLTYSPLETLQILIENQWLSASFEQDGERGARIPAASIWNVKLNKKVNAAVLFFKTENIFNKRYARLTDGFGKFYPLPGRTFWFGLNLYFSD
ncbi:MAG: TonB-dependent receptor [Elusimicrobia bacterium]|nr:TonB-dependent receptor [Elusimicrobiota bacterium]